MQATSKPSSNQSQPNFISFQTPFDFDNDAQSPIGNKSDEPTFFDDFTAQAEDENQSKHAWQSGLEDMKNVEQQFTTYLLQQVGPTAKSEAKRKVIFTKVKSLIEMAYEQPVHVLKYGSDPLKTYLPDSDIDITVMPSSTDNAGSNLSQLKAIYEQLESYQQQRWEESYVDQSLAPQISQLVLVDQADVEIIKLTIADTMVDISIRQVGGFCTILFVERINQKVPFLKDAIILLKAWMTYEASLLGSHAANMATYALYVLVMFLVNNFEVKSPMEVFKLFFHYFGQGFDWDQTMVTIYGPIRTLNFYDRLKTEFHFDLEKFAAHERTVLLQEPSCQMRALLLFSPADLDDLQVNFGVVRCLQQNSQVSVETLYGLQSQKRAMNLKFINLADPCNQLNNLGKSISLFNSHRFREALKLTAEQLQTIEYTCPSSYFSELVDTWKYTFECCGVLPPLVLQMPQVGPINFSFDQSQSNSAVLDIESIMHLRNDKLKHQLSEQGVCLSQLQQEQMETQFDEGMKLRGDQVVTPDENLLSIDQLVELMGGEQILRVLNEKSDDSQKLRQALIRSK